MADNSPRSESRRKALKTIGAGMMTMAGPMIGSTAARSEENVVISIQRGQGNGIGAAEYEKLLSRFIRAAKTKAGLEKLAVANPELSDGENIYALTFIATPGGKAHTYIGSGTNPGAAELQRLHDRSVHFQDHPTVQSSDDDLSTESTDPEKEWNQVGSALWEKTEDPYGIVQNSSEAWRYPEDPNYDVYAATVDAVFEPGYSAYDSTYTWTSALVRHYWGRNYEPGGAYLTDWAPNGDRTGDTEVSGSVSYSGATIGVTYNPPAVQRTDNSSTLNDNVRIKWEPGDTTTDEKIHSPSAASVMKSENFASEGDTLAQTDCRYNVSSYKGDETLSTTLSLTYEG